MKGKTNWDNLAYPRLTGLIAAHPSRLSQAMHNAGFKQLKLDFQYSAFPVTKADAAIAAMRSLGIRGYSVTIPHKEAVMPHLDHISEEAKAVGAVNTIINDGERLWGENTDVVGILKSLEEAKLDLNNKSALVLGAGGAAKAAIYALKKSKVAKVLVANRTIEKAKELAEHFAVDAIQLTELSEADFNKSDLVFQATSLGMPRGNEDTGNIECVAEYPFPLEYIKSAGCLFESVTSETPLEQQATAANVPHICGIRMLFHQAVKQFELFTECSDADVKDASVAMEAALMAQFK